MGIGSRFHMRAQGFTATQIHAVLNTWLIMMLGTIQEVELMIDASDMTREIQGVLEDYFERGVHVDFFHSHSITLTTLPDGGKRVVISWVSRSR